LRGSSFAALAALRGEWLYFLGYFSIRAFMKRMSQLFFMFFLALSAFASKYDRAIWKINNIPPNIEKKMKETGSWKEGCPVPISGLAYLQLSYWGYDNKAHTDGIMIVNKDVAKEVVDIFKELYSNRFPIEKMKLIDDYKAKDDPAMEDNNTSAFNCRPIYGSTSGAWSFHSYGTSIDINTKINPYIKEKDGKKTVSPANGEPFVDRSKDAPGLITGQDSCYKAFTKRGWTWGGTPDWLSKRCNQDYQHFQKQVAEQKPDCNPKQK
jgi:hypothetical protein